MANPSTQARFHHTPADGLTTASLPDIADTVNDASQGRHRRQPSSDSLGAAMGRDPHHRASTTIMNALNNVDRGADRQSTLRSSPRLPDNHYFPQDEHAQQLQVEASMARQRRKSSETLVKLAAGTPSVDLSNSQLEGESSTDDIQRSSSYMQAQQAGIQRLTHSLVETELHNGDNSRVSIDIGSVDMECSTVDDGELGSQDVPDENESTIDPLTVRLVHHVKMEHQGEYEKFLLAITDIAYKCEECAGVTTIPIHYSRNTRWMVILRFLNQQAYLTWRKDSMVAARLRELRLKKVFDMHPKERFKAEVYVGWNVTLTQDPAYDGRHRNRLLSQGYPKYRYIFVLIIAFWLANTVLSFEDNGPDRRYSSYRRALVRLLDTDAGHAGLIVWQELLFVLVAAPLAYFVFAPLVTVIFSKWLKRPVPPEPRGSFILYAIYRVFVTS